MQVTPLRHCQPCGPRADFFAAACSPSLGCAGKVDTSFHVERYRAEVTRGGFSKRTPFSFPTRCFRQTLSQPRTRVPHISPRFLWGDVGNSQLSPYHFLFPDHESRVPHISLVFCEMWDSAEARSKSSTDPRTSCLMNSRPVKVHKLPASPNKLRFETRATQLRGGEAPKASVPELMPTPDHHHPSPKRNALN
jgi:hypothetical protein